MDAATRDVVVGKLVTKNSDDDKCANLTVSIELGKTYHFLVLMGHTERNYAGENPAVKYEYKNEPPTLLAAGFSGSQPINGATTLSITMRPLLVDTVFKYGNVTAQAALGGTELPAGIEASVEWTLKGGFATLLEAQSQTGLPKNNSGYVWGLTLAEGEEETKTILRWTGGGDDQFGAPKLEGADYNQITLGLGVHNANVEGSANFNLTYHPLGQSGTSWIIRNGVNDLAQNENTKFTGDPIPWGTTHNGNGAVVFKTKAADLNLGDLFPAPAAGQVPAKSFFTTQYSGKVRWTPEHITFQEGKAYTAKITLNPMGSYVFPSADNITVNYTDISGTDISRADGKVEATIAFDTLGISERIFIGGTFKEAQGRLQEAKAAGNPYMVIELSPTHECTNEAGDTDVIEANSFTSENSPAKVDIKGGGRRLDTTSNDPTITVGDGVTLTLYNIILDNESNDYPVIKVEAGGRLILGNGVIIRDNNPGGGVSVAGELTMVGGTISGNTAANGGGVYVASGGTFTMDGGIISGNNAANGGGVYVAGPAGEKCGGTFIMNRGTIGGTFDMEGETISGNTATTLGGGVYVAEGGTFTKNGGIIYGSDGEPVLKNTAPQGVGVYLVKGSGGWYRNDTTQGVNLDSGKGFNWEGLPVIETELDVYSLLGEVQWYIIKKPASPFLLQWQDKDNSAYSADIKVSAYRSDETSIFEDIEEVSESVPFYEKIYVKVEGKDSSSGNYALQWKEISEISTRAYNNNKIDAAKNQVDWYYIEHQEPYYFEWMTYDGCEIQLELYISGDRKFIENSNSKKEINGCFSSPEDEAITFGSEEIYHYVKVKCLISGRYGLELQDS